MAAYAIPEVNDPLMRASYTAELHLRRDGESAVGVNLPGPRTGVEKVQQAPGEVDAAAAQPTSSWRVRRPARRCILRQPTSISCLPCFALTPARFSHALG